MTMTKLVKILCCLFLLAFFILFLILPVFTVVEEGLRWNLLREIFENQIYLLGLWNSFRIAVVTTLLVFLISLPLALLYDRYEFPGKSLCSLAMMLPMILPPFVGALGFQQILGHYGVVNTILTSLGAMRIDFLGGEGRFWSVCIIMALHLYPILYLNLVTALGNIDPAMNEAAANLGASKWERLIRITLPLLKPGILAGGSIVLIWSFTELGTPLMFGCTRTTAVQIFNGITELETNPLPYTLVIVMLVLALAMYLLSRLFLRSAEGAAGAKGNMGNSGRPATGIMKILAPGAFVSVTFLAVLPHLALILTAFFRSWYGTVLPKHFTLVHFENALSHKMVIPSIVNSLRYSSLAMIFALAAGLLIALAVARWKFRFAPLLDVLAMTPLAVPGIVIAFGFLGMSVKYSWAREIFNPVENPLLLLAAAYAIRRLPYVVRSVSSGLEQTPEELENAARNMGASPFRTLWKITLPLISANLIVGGLFAFSFSMLEVPDSLILAQKAAFFPITRAIFELSQILGSGPVTACAFGVWTMLFMAATLAAAGILLGRKIGAIFKM
ncbi:MAG: iron ABC transporter permease [Lentisphaeria bacterium]|nr:iron ABC transporter permease [Lentisphaeria bacterium]